MKSKYSNLFAAKAVLSIVLLSILAISCQPSDTAEHTETLYAYEVDVAAESYSAGVLRYMEAELFKGNRLHSKTYYNDDQSIKGVEIYKYEDQDSLPESSTYFGPDDKVLAHYTFINKDGHQVQRNGYDGNSDELLRQERYQYDTAGNRIKKILFDSQDQLQKTYLFAHDQYGNEKEVTIVDAADRLLVKEEFEISFVDEKNRWVEKWGFVQGDKFPKTFYKQSFSK